MNNSPILKIVCAVCGNETKMDNTHKCPFETTELEKELVSIMMVVNCCDHFCCKMTAELCMARSFLTTLEASNFKMVEDTIRE